MKVETELKNIIDFTDTGMVDMFILVNQGKIVRYENKWYAHNGRNWKWYTKIPKILYGNVVAALERVGNAAYLDKNPNLYKHITAKIYRFKSAYKIRAVEMLLKKEVRLKITKDEFNTLCVKRKRNGKS